MSNVTTNGYHEGLNRDLSKHVDQLTTMWNNQNFRITTQDGASYGTIENVKGNNEFLDVAGTQLQIDTGWEIIGHCVVRDDILLFGVLRSGTVATAARIYLYKFSHLTKKYAPRILIYDDDTNALSLNEQISTIGRYENEYIIKIYWTDNDNNVRYINIAPDIDNTTGLPKSGLLQTDYRRVQRQDIEDFELLQKITLSQPTFDSYTSGNIMSGMVQYAYRLYNLYGGVSMFSPTSPLIPIFDKQGNSKVNSYGLETNVQSTMGINGKIVLSGNSLLMDRVEIVSIHYGFYNAVPTINVLDIQKISDTILFTDTGNYTLGQITFSEFTAIKNDFTCKTFDTKDDRLFVGNVKETYFDVEHIDFDARAYRFDYNGRSRCFMDNTSYDRSTRPYYRIQANGIWNAINDDADSGGDWSLPEDANLINPFNILSEDDSPSNPPNKYQSDGVTLGGTGKNISFYFDEEISVLDDDITIPVLSPNLNTNIEQHLGITKGFQRDEIYRFGIVFFDNKGRQSFVKWIVDIRMPSVHEFSKTYLVGNVLKRRNLIPVFTVNNLPINEDGSPMQYQIVHVKREVTDKTVVANCVMSGIGGHVNDEPYYTSEFPKSYVGTNNRGYFELIGTDISMNNINIDNCRLYIEGVFGQNNVENSLTGSNSPYQYVKFTVPNYTTTINTAGNTRILTTIENYNNIGEPTRNSLYPTLTTLNNIQYAAITTGNSSDDYANLIGSSVRTKGILVQIPVIALASNYPLEVYIRRDIIGYGGNTYNNRLRNMYIPCGNLNTGVCNRGDTMVDYHEEMVAMTHTYMLEEFGLIADITYQLDGTDTYLLNVPAKVAYIPTESTTVETLRHDTQFFKASGDDTIGVLCLYDNTPLRRITIPVTVFGNFKEVVDEGFIETGWTDYYLYNRVYSQPNSSKTYISKPLDWQKQVTFDTRIRYSNLKFNGEERDSWLQFMPNNFNEVDSTYGSLNQLVNFRNELFCFQESGFCVAPVNQQVTEISDTGVTTVLGYGEVLPKQFNYNYGSSEVGLQGNNKIIKSLSALYWIDINKRKVYRYSGTVDSFSDVKGLKGYLNNQITNSTTYIGVYDNEFAEVLISFNGTTLVFSELLDVFQGWFTVNPTRYIKTPRDILSTGNNNLLWKHNIGNRASWYDVVSDSIVEIIANSGGSITKEFNNIEYMSEVYDVNDERDVPNETLTTLRASNDLATSQVITLKPYVPGDTLYTGGLEVTLPAGVSNIRRRMRMWRTVVPRVLQINEYQDNIRFRDAYIKLTFTYNNDRRNKLILHPINTYFTLSNM